MSTRKKGSERNKFGVKSVQVRKDADGKDPTEIFPEEVIQLQFLSIDT